MGLSFSYKRDEIPPNAHSKVLITGAAGGIGRYLAEHLNSSLKLKLMVRRRKDLKPLEKFGEVCFADLQDREALKKACADCMTVVHLAGNPSPEAEWSSLLSNNIVGTYHLLSAAREAGCQKVILASSIHAVSGYPADLQVKTSDPVNPGDLYGVSKCFVEAIGRYFAMQEEMAVIAIRIGAFQPLRAARSKKAVAIMDAFVSRRDLSELIRHCIEDNSLRFAIFNGVSNNRFKRLDMTDARELLGYVPADDLTEESVELKPLRLTQRVRSHSQKDKTK